MKKCPNCNKDFKDDDFVCDICTLPLKRAEKPPAERHKTNSVSRKKPPKSVSKRRKNQRLRSPRIPIYNPRPKKSRVKPWQMMILVAAILLFISVFAVLIFGGKASPDDMAVSSAVSDVAEINLMGANL